jgi:hypothetical protein
MNILDHRILVPKSSQVVWEHLSDLSKNGTWQVNYDNISFLTTQHSGVGVRWRYSTTNGREYVAETTAWYDGLGYEYTLIDGVPFRENKGRIRLQEIPEGTIVQWTFSYDPGGLLGGVRNALSFKRQLESVMIDSLKTLWRVVNQANDEGSREVKSILRAGLDYEARAQYKPRHPSAKPQESPTQPVNAPVIVEPPISDEDTRPRAPVVVDVPDEAAAEPAFLVEIPNTDDVADEEFEAITDEQRQAILNAPMVVTPEISIVERGEVSSDLIKAPVNLPDQPVIVDIVPTDVPSIVSPPVQQEQSASEFLLVGGDHLVEEAREAVSSIDTLKMDTAEVSVFDVFGLPKPSETQEMRAVTLPDISVKDAIQAIAVGNKPPRSGLRLIMRRRRTRLRRPG